MNKLLLILLLIFFVGCDVKPTSCYISELDLNVKIIPDTPMARVYLYRNMEMGGDFVEFDRTRHISLQIRYVPPRSFYILKIYSPQRPIKYDIKSREFDFFIVDEVIKDSIPVKGTDSFVYNMEWTDSTIFKIPSFGINVFENGSGFGLYDIDNSFLRYYSGDEQENEIYIK